MELPGPSTDSNYAIGALDVNGLTHMLADQARQSMVAILDVAMPAPSLAGIILIESQCDLFIYFFLSSSLTDLFNIIV